MTNSDKINAFLNREDLSSVEETLKAQVLEVDTKLKALAKERDDLLLDLKNRESELLKLSGAMDAMLAIVLKLSVEEVVGE